MTDVPVADCSDCGTQIPLHSNLLNKCRECGAPHNGCGQRLRDDHNTGSRLAQERGRDPGVGRPGEGPVQRF